MSDTTLRPSLGLEVVRWIEGRGRFAGKGLTVDGLPKGGLVHGPGPIAGQPYRLNADQKQFIFTAYELGPTGRRCYDRAVYSRRKGTAKSEMAAALAACELLGPARFSHFDSKGTPVGRMVSSPEIPMAATAAEQAEVTVYGAFKAVLAPMEEQGFVDVGQEKCHRLVGNAGYAYLISSRSRTRDGGKPTFQVCDETHLWNTEDLRDLHDTLVQNALKIDAEEPWTLEVTTAYLPSERSVAEQSHEYGQLVATGEIKNPRFLFDHLAASTDHNVDTYEGRMAALEEASGRAWAWTRAESILSLWDDPNYDKAKWRRYWLNQIVEHSLQWVLEDEWVPLVTDDRLAPNDLIALGFDGSLYDDATALIAVRLSDMLVQPIRIWEQPTGQEAIGWSVPRGEVDQAVSDCFDLYDVARMYADPFQWEDTITRWADEYGKPVMEWRTNRPTPMAAALSRIYTMIRTNGLHHTGDAILTRHMLNARKRETPQGTLITKRKKHSPYKIDAAVAATLAVEAAADAIDNGALKRHRRRRGRIAAAY